MTKVYTSAMVLIPPEKLRDSIQAIRKKYDRNYHRWMPHITLIYPFRPESEFDALESDIIKVSKDLKPFHTILEKFNFFR
ncbi:MAG: 2'-5' RNA ligase family protein, partial [Promethearchaeota archaeon]